MVNAAPKIDYLSRDFAGMKDSLLQYASATFPSWQPASEGDFGVMLVELFSYQADILSYYTDRAQMENYLATATQRESVLALAYLLGYQPSPGTPSEGTVTLVTNSPTIVVPAGTPIMTGRIDALDGPVTFETNVDVTLTKDVNSDVAVTEGNTVPFLKIGESTGQPNQTFLLPHTGVYSDTIRLYVEDFNGSTEIVQGNKTVQAREWLRLDHLLDADDTDPVFEADLAANNTTQLLLGDDINGLIPPTGLQIFASYRHGFGGSGNLVAGQVYLINSRGLRTVHVAQDPTSEAYLSSAMTGGADPESTDSIRYNAPRAYRTQKRAINEQDFLDLALGVEGVTKANVVVGSFTSVTVYITGPDGGAPTQTLKDFVANKFHDKTLIGVSVTIAEPTFIPVNFGSVAEPMTVILYDQYSRSAVETAILNAIRTFVLSMPFGKPLTVSNVYTSLSGIDGIRSVEIPVMARSDSAQTGTSKITPRVWEVFEPGDFHLDISGGVA